MYKVDTGVATIAALVLLGGCQQSSEKKADTSSSSTEKVTKAEKAQSKAASERKAKLESATTDVDNLFSDVDHTALDESVTQDLIDSVSKEVNKLPNSSKKHDLQADIKKANKLLPGLASSVASSKAKEKSEKAAASSKAASEAAAASASSKAESESEAAASSSSKAESESIASAKASSKAESKSESRAKAVAGAEKSAALSTAEDYANDMHMSKQAVYEQLVSDAGEGFTAEAAQYAVDHLTDVNWNDNALQTAKDYQDEMPMSQSELLDQLTSSAGEQFTQSQAQYALNHLYD
jgi:hypothetical protein